MQKERLEFRKFDCEVAQVVVELKFTGITVYDGTRPAWLKVWRPSCTGKSLCGEDKPWSNCPHLPRTGPLAQHN